MSETQSAAHSPRPLDLNELSCVRLFDEVPCYISVQDRDLRIVEANRKLIDDFGDHISELCYAVYKGRSQPCPECPVTRTFEDGKEHTTQEVIFDRRGLPHDVIVTTKPLRDRQGAIVAVMELFSDITVQKELEHRLHDSLNRFHNLFDAVPCYISVQDRDHIIIEANDRFKESFTSRLGGHCYSSYKRRRDPCPNCPVAKTFEDGQIHQSEEVVIDKNGNQVHVLVYAAPVRDAHGRITAVMEVSTDITEVRALQDRLAALGRLVAGTAHSIKNVLEGLRGGVYIVNLGFKHDKQEEVRTGWEMVERNVARVSSMIMDMLYCARDRSARRLPVSLPSLAREVLELFSARAADFNIRLESEISGEVPDILGEPKDLHSLLSNLVTNAIDACCSDQDESKSSRVLLRLYREAGDAVIQVEDNGIGMDEETRNKLFAMTFSTKGPFGTGLGLLVSHKVATEHGGSISVASTPGQGSTFTVRLPLS